MSVTSPTSSASRESTGGEAMVDQLVAEGVRHVFGIPGVQLDWAVDAFRRRKDALELVVPRHEQATSYMAAGYYGSHCPLSYVQRPVGVSHISLR